MTTSRNAYDRTFSLERLRAQAIDSFAGGASLWQVALTAGRHVRPSGPGHVAELVDEIRAVDEAPCLIRIYLIACQLSATPAAAVYEALTERFCQAVASELGLLSDASLADVAAATVARLFLDAPSVLAADERVLAA